MDNIGYIIVTKISIGYYIIYIYETNIIYMSLVYHNFISYVHLAMNEKHVQD